MMENHADDRRHINSIELKNNYNHPIKKMIRPRAKASRTGTSKHPYKGSSRAVPPFNRRSKSGPRVKWNTIKVVLLITGASIIFGCVYPFAEHVSSTPHKLERNQGSVDVTAFSGDRFLARGVSGLPMDQTPALVGASRGHIECDVDVDQLVYWNDPQGERDNNFKSPFAKPSSFGKTKYITFEPDRGGWNNIRMNLENIFIFAAATGRTLVLPPAAPLYLMNVRLQFQSILIPPFPLPKYQFSLNKYTIILEYHEYRKIKRKSTRDLATSFL
jgi:hypothetical protein